MGSTIFKGWSGAEDDEEMVGNEGEEEVESGEEEEGGSEGTDRLDEAESEQMDAEDGGEDIGEEEEEEEEESEGEEEGAGQVDIPPDEECRATTPRGETEEHDGVARSSSLSPPRPHLPPLSPSPRRPSSLEQLDIIDLPTSDCLNTSLRFQNDYKDNSPLPPARASRLAGCGSSVDASNGALWSTVGSSGCHNDSIISIVGGSSDSGNADSSGTIGAVGDEGVASSFGHNNSKSGPALSKRHRSPPPTERNSSRKKLNSGTTPGSTTTLAPTTTLAETTDATADLRPRLPVGDCCISAVVDSPTTTNNTPSTASPSPVNEIEKEPVKPQLRKPTIITGNP
eukprot:GHVS01004595.1.p1 GENE.GHVS01004595.1~~GHVS01004595.1.p1  ORF type:complete len:341 (-),score=111.01 GHVS01004595.1:1008-2030(-)